MFNTKNLQGRGRTSPCRALQVHNLKETPFITGKCSPWFFVWPHILSRKYTSQNLSGASAGKANKSWRGRGGADAPDFVGGSFVNIEPPPPHSPERRMGLRAIAGCALASAQNLGEGEESGWNHLVKLKPPSGRQLSLLTPPEHTADDKVPRALREKH